MARKSFPWKKLLDGILVAVIVVLLFFPNIRAPVLGSVQRVILLTGFFNAESSIDQRIGNIRYGDLRLTTEEGQRVNVQDLKDKTLFINVWATWCPPCLAEMPDIEQLYRKVGGEVVFLMISVDENRDKAKQWVKDKQYPVPIFFFEGSLPNDLSYEALPTTWVVGPEGEVRYQHSGMASYDTPEFREFLLSL